ncbi:hypothetical protein ACP275_09G052900 [Erythranthe tilingii]
MVHQRIEEWGLIKNNLTQAQARMKWYAYKHIIERSFEVGEDVYLKLQLFRQNLVVSRTSQMLANKYYGPYHIIAKIGKMAYKLLLPEGAKIHNVFHVSLLKRMVKPTATVTKLLPAAIADTPGPLVTEPSQDSWGRESSRGGGVMSYPGVRRNSVGQGFGWGRRR